MVDGKQGIVVATDENGGVKVRIGNGLVLNRHLSDLAPAGATERRLVPITQEDMDAGWTPGLDDPGSPGMRLETDAELRSRLKGELPAPVETP